MYHRADGENGRGVRRTEVEDLFLAYESVRGDLHFIGPAEQKRHRHQQQQKRATFLNEMQM